MLGEQSDISVANFAGARLQLRIIILGIQLNFNQHKTGEYLMRKNKEKFTSVNTDQIAQEFMRDVSPNLIFAKEFFWFYQNGVWKQQEKRAIAGKIQSMIAAYNPSWVKSRLVEDIYRQVSRSLDMHFTGEFDSQKNLVCLENCVLDTETLETLPHDRNLFQTINFPFAYVPDAKAPLWLKFLDEIFPKNLYGDTERTKARLQEWAGYCLIPTAKLEKCLYLHGEDQNGKGVFLKILASMLGDNIVFVEPKNMFSRFQLIVIMGKLVNICSGIKSHTVMSPAFENVVSGGPCTCDIKYKNKITFSPFAKHIFSSNQELPSEFLACKFFRGLDMLTFRRQFSEKDQDEMLVEKLQKEVAGIFNWALVGLQRLRGQNWGLTSSDDFKQIHKENYNVV